MNKPIKQPVVKSFYNYKLIKYDNINYNKGFIPKYDLNVTNKTKQNYNDNKYNLKRDDVNYEMSYESADFTPDSYYQFNLKDMSNKKMELNNYQTELGIGNDFNRRIRNDDTGETLQEIAIEDDERTTALKILLTTYNKNYVKAITNDDKTDLKDKYEEDKNTENRKYNKPTIMKVPENIRFNNAIKQGKKIAKINDKLQFDINREYVTDKDMFNNIEKDRFFFYRNTKLKKQEKLDAIENYNKDKEDKILEKTNIVKRLEKNYIKKVKEEDNKDYLYSEKSGIPEISIKQIKDSIYEICNRTESTKLTIQEKRDINKILTNNNFNRLESAASNKINMTEWLENRNII